MAEQAFKWNAADYAAQSSAQKIWAEELIANLNFSATEQVLDLGCGDGKISAAIASCLTGGKVVGIDASEDMVLLAQQIFAANHNLSFKQDDATDFLYKEKFDVIFSNAVLHWVKDHLAVLNNCYQSLRSGGKIVLQMGGKGNAHEFIDIVTRVTSQQKWQAYFETFTFPYHFYGVNDYENWLISTGFQARRVELINKDMQHQGTEGLAGWFRTTWMPYTNQLPEHKRESFINDIVETYFSDYPIDESGNTHIKMVRLEVEAFKA